MELHYCSTLKTKSCHDVMTQPLMPLQNYISKTGGIISFPHVIEVDLENIGKPWKTDNTTTTKQNETLCPFYGI